MSAEIKIIVFCDGGCEPNPGPAGWGYIISDSKTVTEGGGHESFSTNIRAEKLAAIGALARLADTPGIVTIYTDSKFLIDGITKWVHRWKVDGWKTKEGPLKNIDLWVKLDQVVSAREKLGFVTKWVHVKGHKGIGGNERADQIADAFTRQQSIQLANEMPVSLYPVDLTDLAEHPDKASRKYNWKAARRQHKRSNRTKKPNANASVDVVVALDNYIQALVRRREDQALSIYSEFCRNGGDPAHQVRFKSVYSSFKELSAIQFLEKFQNVSSANVSEVLDSSSNSSS